MTDQAAQPAGAPSGFCSRCYADLPQDGVCPRCDGAPSAQPAGSRIQELSDRVADSIGLERIEGFSARAFFSDLFKRRTAQEVEAHFAWGFPGHVPALQALSAQWPRPWAFLRVLASGALLFALFVAAWAGFENHNLYAGLILTGSFAAPVAMVVFFYEMNIPRNVSIYHLVRLFLLGGVAALFVALSLYAVIPLDSVFGAPAAGVIEEVAKLAIVATALRMMRLGPYAYLLNALLIGATIGAGFAAFESAGYALRTLLGELADTSVLDIIVLRGVLSPFGHIAWTAIAAAALWRVCGSGRVTMDALKDPRFLRLFALSVGLHAAWDLDLGGLNTLKYAALGVVAVVAVLSLLQSGIRQIARLQAEAAITPMEAAR